MPTFEYGGRTGHYIESGAGDPAVLLHAGGSSARQWRKLSILLENNYRLLALDLLGCGGTDPWDGPGELTHDAQAALVRGLIESVCDDPVHVVGHSYGGATAMRLYLAAPALVHSLVFIEPIMTPLLTQAGEEALFAEYRAVAEDFIRRVEMGNRDDAWHKYLNLRNGDGFWEGLSDDARQRFIDRTDRSIDGFKSNLSNPTTLSDCRSVDVPTMIICGSKTTAPERRVTEILHDQIRSNTYKIIFNAAHMSPITHPEEVAELLRSHWENNFGQ